MSHLMAGHVEFSQEVSIFISLYTCIVRFCVLHLTFRPVLEGWGSDRFISLPLLDNHELIFGMEYPSIAVRWSPSSSIISTSCCEDPLLEFSSWDTSRLSCQHWRDISSNRIEKKNPQNFAKFYLSSFVYLNSGCIFFSNCVCFEGSAAVFQSSPLPRNVFVQGFPQKVTKIKKKWMGGEKKLIIKNLHCWKTIRLPYQISL